MDRYTNATKATWRGWAWNQVQKRSPKRALVMCLCGDSAQDLQYAKKRGLRCVGVDMNKDCVATFRKAGGVAVQGQLSSMAMMVKPHAVIADMLGGITQRNAMDPVLLLSFFHGFVWNGLRGRDQIGASISRVQGNNLIPDYSTGRCRWVEQGKHRGKAVFMLAVSVAWQAHIGMPLQIDDGNGCSLEHREVPRWFVQFVGRLRRPCYASYRSKDGGQWFDSVAMTGDKKTEMLGELEWRNSHKTRGKLRRAAAAKAMLTIRYGKTNEENV